MATPSPYKGRPGQKPTGGFYEQLAGALRTEVQQHGVLLEMFEEQHLAIFNRNSARVLQLTAAIQKQVELVHGIRMRREALMAQVLRQAKISPQTPLMALVGRFPVNVQPVMRSLIEEVVRVADRVRAKANQNQMLLARSIDLIQELLEEVSPQPGGRIYHEDGSVKIKFSGTGTTYIR